MVNPNLRKNFNGMWIRDIKSEEEQRNSRKAILVAAYKANEAKKKAMAEAIAKAIEKRKQEEAFKKAFIDQFSTTTTVEDFFANPSA